MYFFLSNRFSKIQHWWRSFFWNYAHIHHSNTHFLNYWKTKIYLKKWKNRTDLINTPKPDERAIMTYVSCYYHAFQGAQQVNHSNVQKPQVPYKYYDYNNNVTKSFHHHYSTQKYRFLIYIRIGYIQNYILHKLYATYTRKNWDSPL